MLKAAPAPPPARPEVQHGEDDPQTASAAADARTGSVEPALVPGYRVAELAKLIGASPRFVLKAIEAGVLPAKRVGKHFRIPRSAGISFALDCGAELEDAHTPPDAHTPHCTHSVGPRIDAIGQ